MAFCNSSWEDAIYTTVIEQHLQHQLISFIHFKLSVE